MQRKIFSTLAICLSAFVFSTTALAQQKFTVSITAAQEVPVRPSNGKGSCVVTLNTAETQITIGCSYSGTTSNVVAGHIHDAGPVGVNGPVRFNFSLTGGTSGTFGPLTFNVTPVQVADLRAKRWYVNIHTANFTGGEIRGQVKPATTPFDFDGDGRTDFRVLRTSENGYYVLNSVNGNITFNSFAGTGTLSSVADDYDGDGRSDLVSFFTEGTTRVWRILQTATNTVREERFGTTAATDQVLPSDYDGDGKTDIAIFRRTTGVWYILRSTDGQTQAEVYGVSTAPNDIGAVGDFDKDGKSDLTVIRGGANFINWFTRRSSDGQTQVVGFGGSTAPAGDTIFAAAQVDIDGDGAQDHTIVRDSNGTATTGGTYTVYIRRSSDGQQFSLPYGLDTDALRFGDYDGDGKTDIVARRTENGIYNWYVYQSSNAQVRVVSFGGTGDLRFFEPEEVNSQFEIF